MREKHGEKQESQGVHMGLSVAHCSPGVEGDCDRLQGAP